MLEKEGLLEPLSVEGVPALETLMPTGRRKNDAFILMSLAAMNITYNTDKVKPEDLPKSWSDLADAKYQGKVILPTAEGELHRVSVRDFASKEEALAQLPELKKEYGNNIWILNY